ncbi:TPA: glycosyltransferase family 4 protein [Streptococcus suis]
MKKVLMISTVPSMIGQFNMSNIKLLMKLGFEVHVACNFKDRSVWSEERVQKFQLELNKLGIKQIQIDFPRSPFHFYKLFKSYLTTFKLLHTEKYIFLHCHAPVAGIISRIAGIGNQVKIIYTAHGFHFYRNSPVKNWILYFPIELLLSLHTDTLITINQEDYTIAKNMFFMRDLHLIEGVGVDYKRFYPNRQAGILKKQKLGFSQEDKIVIYVGELSTRKNQTFLVEVMSLIVKKNPSVKLLLVGKGELYSKIKTEIENYQLSDNVFLLGYREDIDELMQASDLAVSSSRQEGLPVNLMEALGVALPIVATDCRGNRDIVQNEQNGYLISNFNVTLFADAILNILNNVSISEYYSKSSLVLSKKYDINYIETEMENLYKKFLLQKNISE